ncbi:OmpA family protein [Alphaproteobacteria bacterium GH1-50]|uniref:OmpA family protein n=1 Tax=Kangsaoukella pontilimi TaxID=2691042 RepID=A0A7C9MLJ4_9RHOB|nr:OmpA family protein [Kangsaoukella pontilimi]MXQ09295.1 OmpA family protein [Kangsaoukella pontilimi]
MTTLRGYIPHALALALGAGASAGAALWVKESVETAAMTDISLVLAQTGQDWAEVQVDGLQVTMTGTAPDEATRFAALSAAGSVVDASRIIDSMEVEAAAAIAAPEFAIEILKNDGELSVIGLVPTESGPDTILERARRIAGTAQITDLIESADFAPPPGWERALAFGLDTLDMLPRSKVSITPGRVAVSAVAATPERKREIERELNRDVPQGIALSLEIAAPRPVIAPFTLRYIIDEDGGRFDACSADTEAARDRILATAISAGLQGDASCTLGLGVPSTRWGEAASLSIATLAAIGQGTVTLSNTAVSLVALEGTDADLFERETGELEGALPDVFSLTAVLPVTEEVDDTSSTAPEFTATRSPEGLVQLRGKLADERSRMAIEAFAAAHFGVASLTPATRLDENVPAGWSMRVLTALEALALLNNGSVRVTDKAVNVSGVSGREDARAEVARVLSSKLSDGIEYEIDVSYSEALDPLAALPTPEECVRQINAVATANKITFAPGSSDIEPDALPTIDAIAELLRDCQTVQIEIGGHTDSQGRESMNQQLSQTRADAVLNAIMSRRVLTSNLTAKGYGESEPIADNGTEEGREANRRIEFKLILPEETEAEDDTAEAEGEASQ